jgi:hypothetical protein
MVCLHAINCLIIALISGRLLSTSGAGGAEGKDCISGLIDTATTCLDEQAGGVGGNHTGGFAESGMGTG